MFQLRPQKDIFMPQKLIIKRDGIFLLFFAFLFLAVNRSPDTYKLFKKDRNKCTRGGNESFIAGEKGKKKTKQVREKIGGINKVGEI